MKTFVVKYSRKGNDSVEGHINVRAMSVAKSLTEAKILALSRKSFGKTELARKIAVKSDDWVFTSIESQKIKKEKLWEPVQ